VPVANGRFHSACAVVEANDPRTIENDCDGYGSGVRLPAQKGPAIPPNCVCHAEIN